MWTPLSKQDNLMNDVFKIMLDLEEPWKLVNIEHDPKEETWHLFIDFERGALFPCPHCGTPCKAYDAEKKQWRTPIYASHWTHTAICCQTCKGTLLKTSIS
ncbi:hypothetical protein MKY19_11535 [Paenibacillus sp. FSL R5-0744]|uniref:hypothetical protein n=1 Tax=Paenibacillus sp. FSL R5-0744 TaxID=2921656 RepID=UPI0030DC39F9